MINYTLNSLLAVMALFKNNYCLSIIHLLYEFTTTTTLFPDHLHLILYSPGVHKITYSKHI